MNFSKDLTEKERSTKRSERQSTFATQRTLDCKLIDLPHSPMKQWIEILLCILAGGMAWTMAVRTAGTVRIPGCTGNSGCAALAAGRWARWMNLPVAALAGIVYLLIAIAIGLIQLRPEAAFTETTRQLVLGAGIFIGASAIWYVGLQVIVIRQVCLYCNIIHLLGAIVAFLILIPPSNFTGPTHFVSSWGTPLAIGLVGMIGLIAGQLLSTPKTFAVVSASGACDRQVQPSVPTQTSAAVSSSLTEPPIRAASPSALATGRETSLLAGRLPLRTDEFPFIGARDARHMIAFLFDYTCETCRSVHNLLGQIIKTDRSRLGIIILPLPQHPGCNHTIKKICPGRGQACQYARLALAVWRHQPDNFEEFNHYLLGTPQAPPLGLALREAEKLVGIAINPNQSEPTFDRLIARVIEIHRSLKIKTIPNLLLPRSELAGDVKSIAELEVVLTREFRPRVRK